MIPVPSAIVIRDLVKVFKKRRDSIRAVDRVSLEIRTGELLGLLGPNGAGKTTLIKCLSTLLIPDQGTVIIAGHDVNRSALSVRRAIGVMTGGERALYWKLTPVENLRYFAALYGVPGSRIKERISYLLDLMGLQEKAAERVEKLSSGMKQKLSLARSLIHDPPILLIDEPTLGLDPHFARFIRRFIKEELHGRQGKTILLTTHYMDEADELCERIAFMNHGRIETVDSPQALKQHLRQRQTLEIKCQGTLDRCDFAGIPGQDTVRLHTEDGITLVRLTAENPEAMMSAVVDLIRTKARILGISVTEPTLEDVFVALTGASLKESQDADNN